MGFWVSTPNIQRLIAKLDWKFSDGQINKIKNNSNKLARFDPANRRNLRNVARLMRIWPGATANNADAKKWYGFLTWLHQHQNAATGHVIADDIRAAIFGGLQDSNCRSISFVAIEGSDIRLTTSQLPVTPGPDHVLVLMLQTVDAGGVTDSDPGPRDGNDSEDSSGDDLPGVGAATPAARLARKPRRGGAKSAKKSKAKKTGSPKKAKAKKASKRRR
jgi:hypothetical protein